MKEEASAKELENLLREALNTGLDTPRGGTPLIQLKTVPLQVQHIPMIAKKAAPAPLPKPVPASVPAVDIEPSPNSEPNLADKLAPESVPPKALRKDAQEKKRTSKVALGIMGLFVLGAVGGAVYLARDRHAVSLANAATNNTAPQQQVQTPPAAVTATAEGAVGIAVASRPVQAPDSKADPNAGGTAISVTPAPPPTFAAAATTTAAAPAPPPPVVAAKAPAPAMIAATPTPVEKPAPTAKPSASHHAAKPPSEPKPEKTAAADKPEKAPPPPPAPTPASVDALLQQQLKGAIP